MFIPPEAVHQNDPSKITLTLLRDPPSVDIQDGESVACYGIRCDPPNMIFHQPVKIRIPHSTLAINPDQVKPDIVSHVWDSVNDLPRTSRMRSSSSPDEPPYCRLYERHLELYIGKCAEWWVLIPLEQQLIRHQLMCTPYIPETLERGKEIEVHLHVHADVPGMDAEVRQDEKHQAYRKAHRSVPFSTISHAGDVTVARDCDGKMAETKLLSLKKIHNRMRHNVVFNVPPSEDDVPIDVITITLTQSGKLGMSRSMAFVIRYEDQIKSPEFTPVIREIEGTSRNDLPDKDVQKIAEKLSIDDFYDLGVALGFQIQQLDAIEYKRLKDRQEAICEMLITWKQRQLPHQNVKEVLLSILKSLETEAENTKMTDESLPPSSSATPEIRATSIEPIEPEYMDIITTSETERDEINDDLDQCGGTPSTEELCSVALPVTSLPLACSLGKALRLNDDLIVGFIDLPSSSVLQKIARQLVDSWWNGLKEDEKGNKFATLLSEFNISDVKTVSIGCEEISKTIGSKTKLLDLCHRLSVKPSDILLIMSTFLIFPPHMIGRSALKMLKEWVHHGGTRKRLLEVAQAFRFNEAAVKIAESMTFQASYKPFFSHGIIGHKGGELTLDELGIAVSIPEGALPKGMRSVVTLSVPTHDTPRLPVREGEVVITPVIEGSLTQELLKPATVVLPHCTTQNERKDDSSVILYTRTGPGTFGRRNMNPSQISKDTITFRTSHLQVWALSSTDLQGLQLKCVVFQPLFMTPAEKPTLRAYILHPYRNYVEVFISYALRAPFGTVVIKSFRSDCLNR
ncbi:uncharacterized protein LOC105442849 [Strongylocentrotus purpuratus]|uniref:Netrin receptor UNC5 n=1 Tax=Strongylocentrotus purpuratus TaxID=7668 RepID=A0A7M7P1X5_STRPU|nr:uncharacterized protein LOC105442849 [Strongylocentrotus purpuratus]